MSAQRGAVIFSGVIQLANDTTGPDHLLYPGADLPPRDNNKNISGLSITLPPGSRLSGHILAFAPIIVHACLWLQLSEKDTATRHQQQ